MCSRRAFMTGLFLLGQVSFVNKVWASMLKVNNRKFLKQGWLLQEGDV